MKIAVIGAGAMGGVIGGRLAQAGHTVSFIEVNPAVVEAINERGLRIEDKSGQSAVVRVRATAQAGEIGPVDLALIFVKCYHTEAAVKSSLPLIGPETVVLTLQNGWGNGPRIGAVIGKEKLLLGVCYHSASVLGPGHVMHSGQGKTFIGEFDGAVSERLGRVADAFQKAGFEVTATTEVVREIWSKLALNVCTLPTSALLRFHAPELMQHRSMVELMQALLREVVAVARAKGIGLEFDERWAAISGLLGRLAPTAKASMLQDVENRRQTEIDVINGAIVDAGTETGIATPYNQSMVWMIKSLEETFGS